MHFGFVPMESMSSIGPPKFKMPWNAGADKGFLEKGLRCVKKGGVRFADFISFFLNIP